MLWLAIHPTCYLSYFCFLLFPLSNYSTLLITYNYYYFGRFAVFKSVCWSTICTKVLHRHLFPADFTTAVKHSTLICDIESNYRCSWSHYTSLGDYLEKPSLPCFSCHHLRFSPLVGVDSNPISTYFCLLSNVLWCIWRLWLVIINPSPFLCLRTSSLHPLSWLEWKWSP